MSNRLKWNKDNINKLALKYSTRSAFKASHYNAYMAAQKKGLLNIVCSHMPKLVSGFEHKATVWSLDKLINEALKYKTRGSFCKNSPIAYSIASKKNILNKVCAHMPKHVDQSGKRHPRFKWTEQKLQQEALKYKTRGEFKLKNGGAYCAARRCGILSQICSHMDYMGSNSIQEKELLNQIRRVYPHAKSLKHRKISIPNKPFIKGFDIDIYIPELNKGIEFDGDYHHSTAGLNRSRSHWPIEDIKNYHKIKDDYFKSIGIDVLHIKEKDWKKNKEKELKKCLEFLNVK